jgi:ankyrin repeat protein
MSGLIEAGADVNVRDGFDRTAFTIALEEGNGEIVNILKEAGAAE